MQIQLANHLPPDEIREFLRKKMPGYGVKSPWLSPNIVIVHKGVKMVSIRVKGNTLKIRGGLNTQNFWVIIPVGAGIIFGLIGAVLVIGVFWLFYAKKLKEMERLVVKKFTDASDGSFNNDLMEDSDLLDDHLL